MELICEKPGELDIIAGQLLVLHPKSMIFAFYGKLGAGKTTFIKSICRKLNVTDTVISPSFGILHEYKTRDNSPVYHFDFFRIKNISEFLDLGCEEYFYSGLYCFIEWPEKIEDFLPESHVAVFIEEKKGKRIIKF
ncbi:MAG: tRNA (adenosine(37)-N6)-threonylcarbamoyltransferase complex ATPase subunit type 1 TsaE [Bacteroidales bacterium]